MKRRIMRAGKLGLATIAVACVSLLILPYVSMLAQASADIFAGRVMPGISGTQSLEAMKTRYEERRIRINEISVEARKKANKLTFLARPISMSAGKLSSDGKLIEVDRLILCPTADRKDGEQVPLDQFNVVRSVSTKFVDATAFNKVMSTQCKGAAPQKFSAFEKSWSLLAGLPPTQKACAYKETLGDGTIRFLTYHVDLAGSVPLYTRTYRAINGKFCPPAKDG